MCPLRTMLTERRTFLATACRLLLSPNFPLHQPLPFHQPDLLHGIQQWQASQTPIEDYCCRRQFNIYQVVFNDVLVRYLLLVVLSLRKVPPNNTHMSRNSENFRNRDSSYRKRVCQANTSIVTCRSQLKRETLIKRRLGRDNTPNFFRGITYHPGLGFWICQVLQLMHTRQKG